MNAPDQGPVAVCSACGAEMEGDSTACFLCGHTRRTAPLRKGQVISGRYELTGVLGRGGMGTVYEAHDRSLDERVALKVLAETAHGSADADRRFRAEIKLARKIRHPNVCAIHEYGELQDLQYIVMEFVGGQDLKKYLRSRGTLTTNEAVDLSCQVGEGLQAIHEAGVVHRDLKLANVMRDASGRLRLMDFGIAKGMTDTTATATGHIVGTPEYMSPEQARGEKVDQRSDVYALGIMTHELLTGRVPFKADTPLATMMLHVNEPPRLDDPRIPRALAPVLGKALAKRADERYESARDFVAALRAATVSVTSSTLVSATPASSAPDQATVEIAATARSKPLPRTLAREAISKASNVEQSIVGRSGRRWALGVGAMAGALVGLAVVVWLGVQAIEMARGQPSPTPAQPVSEEWPGSRAPSPVPRGPSESAPEPFTQPTAATTIAGGGTARATPPARRPSILPLAASTPAIAALALPPTRAPEPTPEEAREAVARPAPAPAPPITAAPSAVPTPPVEIPPAAETPPPPQPATTRDTSAPATAPRPVAMALLVINVKPAAEITLDGKVLGETGAYSVPVAPGEHVIRFSHKNWQPLSRTVSVGSGERVRVSVDLKDEGIPRKK